MKLTLPEFLVSIILIVFLWVIVDVVWSGWRLRREHRRLARRVRECHLCGKIYQDDERARLSQCPDCSAANTRRPHRRLA